MSNCVFCEILYGAEPAEVVYDGIATIGIVPLKPVTEGHVIFIPRKHVRDAIEDTDVTAQVMADTANYVGLARLSPSRKGLYDSVNIITSVGEPATQSVFHLHTHVVPRHTDDGLALPWHSGKGEYV